MSKVRRPSSKNDRRGFAAAEPALFDCRLDCLDHKIDLGARQMRADGEAQYFVRQALRDAESQGPSAAEEVAGLIKREEGS